MTLNMIEDMERVCEYTSDFNEWVSKNEDFILDEYIESIGEFPEDIYECVLDDDYPEAEERYCEALTINDVPDNFIRRLYGDNI